MTSPGWAAVMAARSEPRPLSALLVTTEGTQRSSSISNLGRYDGRGFRTTADETGERRRNRRARKALESMGGSHPEGDEPGKPHCTSEYRRAGQGVQGKSFPSSPFCQFRAGSLQMRGSLSLSNG